MTRRLDRGRRHDVPDAGRGRPRRCGKAADEGSSGPATLAAEVQTVSEGLRRGRGRVPPLANQVLLSCLEYLIFQ